MAKETPLYLKLLEHENRTPLQRQRELLADEMDIALLPPMQDNIKCGNSLIASNFSMMPEIRLRPARDNAGRVRDPPGTDICGATGVV